MSQTQPISLQQFVETSKTNYISLKGHQNAEEYISIIMPYLKIIEQRDQQIKVLQEKLQPNEKGKKNE
ncbi:MAG: hypothetical protein KC444_07895 [Nitrosopumilus sp.]|nr:hypothetical protein [Nitrosopumilus sp.]